MARMSTEREMEGLEDNEEEISERDPSYVNKSDQWKSRETDDECEQEEKTANLKYDTQDITNPATPQDSGIGEIECCGSPEAKEGAEEALDALENESDDGNDDPQVINQEEDEAAKEQHMNGESSWRNLGRRFKVRSSGSVSEQNSQSSSSSFSSSSFQKANVVSSGGRHKQTRRRNHHHHQLNRGRRRTGNQLILAFKEMLSESVTVWCISCVHMMIEIIVTLAHNCGVGVESGGLKLYSFGQHLFEKITDIPGMKADACRVLKWTKCTGADVLDKIVRSAKWTKTAALSTFRLFCALAVLGSHWLKGVLVRLTGERGKRYWTAFQESRFWKRTMLLLEGARNRIRIRRDGHAQPSAPESPSRAGRGHPGQELERLLALAEVPEEELDPFTVLGVEVHASEAELKKAYRQLAVQVHPDKNKHPRAGEAFKVLRAAWDIVSNPETRREYELKRMAATELSKSMNEFLTKLQDDLKEAMNTMMCTKCEGKHKRFEMDREPAEARFCAECNRCHSAEEGDLWAESSMLGLRITYFACMDGKVYDITEWAGCQRIGISPDTHRVPYHISFGSKNNSNSARQRTPSEHPPGPANPADLQDFFNRIFKGGAPNDMAANGGFFPSGPPHQHPPGGAGPPPFSPPTGQSGFFMPGGPRPDPGETLPEGGKPPPRRKKKVRKPFQR